MPPTNMTSTIVLSMAAVGSLSATAHAATIYGMDHLTSHPDPIEFDHLIVFDSEDPTDYEIIGSTGVSGIGFGGLDFDAEGNLWAYASFYQATGGAASGLYKVDPSTGEATVQGTLSWEILQDIAFNPADGKMYGVNTQINTLSTLYEINLETGAVTPIGEITGLPQPHSLIGMAFDSQGNLFVHNQLADPDTEEDMIYKGAAPNILDVSPLYGLFHNTWASQGMTIDWSRDDMGYHPLVAQPAPFEYLVQFNTFRADGLGYFFGEQWPHHPDGIPVLQLGDIAIMPDVPDEVYGDLTGDGAVNVFDLLELLGAWGACPEGGGCPADLTEDGQVNVFDLLELLGAWG